jgi:hypothetical protein
MKSARLDRSLDYDGGWFRVREALFDELVAFPRFRVTLLVWLVLERRARRAGAGPRASRNGIIDVDVGQAVYGERELAGRIGIDRESGRKRIRTAIRNLERRGVLTAEHGKDGTIVTFIDYPRPRPAVGANGSGGEVAEAAASMSSWMVRKLREKAADVDVPSGAEPKED